MIYLDHNATTPVLPEVFEAMRPCFCEERGNPPSAYKFGSKPNGVIETAWAQVRSVEFRRAAAGDGHDSWRRSLSGRVWPAACALSAS
jgi:cysteine desulfurase